MPCIDNGKWHCLSAKPVQINKKKNYFLCFLSVLPNFVDMSIRWMSLTVAVKKWACFKIQNQSEEAEGGPSINFMISLESPIFLNICFFASYRRDNIISCQIILYFCAAVLFLTFLMGRFVWQPWCLWHFNNKNI